MRRLARFLKKYRFQVIAGPIFKLIEAIFELIVPLVMADMIRRGGGAAGNVQYIWQRGGVLLVLGVVGLASSLDLPDAWRAAPRRASARICAGSCFHHINTLVLPGAGPFRHAQPDYAHDGRHQPDADGRCDADSLWWCVRRSW